MDRKEGALRRLGAPTCDTCRNVVAHGELVSIDGTSRRECGRCAGKRLTEAVQDLERANNAWLQAARDLNARDTRQLAKANGRSYAQSVADHAEFIAEAEDDWDMGNGILGPGAED